MIYRNLFSGKKIITYGENILWYVSERYSSSLFDFLLFIFSYLFFFFALYCFLMNYFFRIHFKHFDYEPFKFGVNISLFVCSMLVHIIETLEIF